MELIQYLWLVLFLFVIFLGLIPLKLFFKDRDEKKLMYAIGLLLSTISFLILGLGFIKYGNSSLIADILYLWGAFIYIILLFYITLERLLNNDKIKDYLFNLYIFTIIISFVLISSNVIPSEVYSFFMAFGSALILIFCIGLIIKFRNISSYLFLLSISSILIASILLTQIENKYTFADYFSFYAYFIGYIFLGLIFSLSIHSTDDQKGLDSYFSIKKTLLKTKEELAKSTKTVQDLFHQMIEPAAVVNKKGEILDVSTKSFEELGYSKEELIGKNFLTLEFIDSKTKIFLLKNLLLRFAGKDIKPYEITISRKDGKKVPYEIHAGKIQYEGKPADMVIFRNLSEWKKTQEEVTKLAEVIKNSSELIHLTTLEGQMIFLNDTGSEMLGIDSEDIHQHTTMHIISNKYSDLVKNEVFPTLMKQGSWEGDLQYKNVKNGSIFDVHSLLFVIYDQTTKKPRYLANVALDITARKLAEKELYQTHKELKTLNKELEQKVKERTEQINDLLVQKDEFINQLGHDLKNPLGPMLNLLPILEKNEKDSDKKEMLRIINRNVQYMKNLISKTIKLAQLRSPNTIFHFETNDLNKIIDEVIENNKLIFDQHHIVIENNMLDDLQADVDKLQIHEVFTNLLNNAVNYTEDNGVITIEGNKRDDQTILFTIKDTGIGMDKEQVSKIFNEFYKGNSQKSEFKSSGLGLTICKRIIERHQGKIWVESEGIGKGSTFYFTIPEKHTNSNNEKF